MGKSSPATTVALHHPTLNKCAATKTKISKSHSTSSTVVMDSSCTRADVYRFSANVSLPSNCYVSREVSDPIQVGTSTVPWHIIHGVNLTQYKLGQEGVQKQYVI